MEIVGVSVCCASSSQCSVAVSSLSQSYYTYFRFIYFLFCFIVSAQSYILNPHVLQVYNFTHNPKHFKKFLQIYAKCVSLPLTACFAIGKNTLVICIFSCNV